MATPDEHPPPPAAPDHLIAGQFAVDFARPVAEGGGGLRAFAAASRATGRTDLMAVLAAPGRPPRARALAVLATIPPDGLLAPLAHGRIAVPGGTDAYAVVAPAPPAPAVAALLRPVAQAAPAFTETELIELVLRPAAVTLDRMHARGVTHRAIRPDNAFLGRTSGGAGAITLGNPCAAPPASLQPAVCEPPYSAMCLPAGRGNGLPADDIYALGVLFLALALGRMPLAGLDQAAVIRRKIDLGSYAALAGDERLPQPIADLARGMLADDPEHRPTAALLLDPAAARTRRLAARPPRRAPRALDIGGIPAWDARALAHTIAVQPAAGIEALRNQSVDRWLRRQLSDPGLGARVDDLLRQRALDSRGEDDARADALLAMRAVAALDPLAPLAWQGRAWFPDGTGAALAAAVADDPETAETIERAILADAPSLWAALRPDRCDEPLIRMEARQQRALLTQRGGGRARLLYTLNPLLPCASPLLAPRLVTRLPELLPALDGTAALAERRRGAPVDADILAFVAARADDRIAGAGSIAAAGATGNDAVAQLRLLAELQTACQNGPAVALAGWLVERAEPLVAAWHNKAYRARLAAELQSLAQAGLLAPMLALIEDRSGRAADTQGAAQAAHAIALIDREIAALAEGGPARADYAARLGQEIAVGAGISALALALALSAFG
jgi:hypothetical protein